jgi:hypothetical protein
MQKMILVRRGYLLAQSKAENEQWAAFYAAKLLNTFGVLVDRPKQVTEDHVHLISKFYGVNIPKSFYANPQDLKYFTTTELLLEQIVSYINVELVDGVFSEDPTTFERIDLFGKALPNYKEGEEVVFRNYKIITLAEADTIMKQIAEDLSLYTRKWSETESEEFQWLFDRGYVNKTLVLKSKDNAIEMFEKTYLDQFAKSLDQKDVVKLSISMVGEQKELNFTTEQAKILRVAIRNCYATALSKKQAKFFSQLTNKVDKRIRTDNSRSPYKKAKALIDAGRVVEAAQVFARSGSLLERNLVWLLSRAKFSEIQAILDLVEIKNPIVGIQLLQTLTRDTNKPRTFRFYKNRLVKNHVETETEVQNRKSVLSKGIKEEVTTGIYRKIDEYYMNLPKLGRVYVSDEFKNIPVPFNTSASGSGLDVMPVGSRMDLAESKIRAFVYWKGIYDIDSSMSFIHRDGTVQELGFWNYSEKLFGNDALHSGDDRSSNGAEYIDLDLDGLVQRGYEFAVFGINAFNGNFTQGETFSGFQFKKDLNTKVWKPNNIRMKVQISGKSTAFFTFGVDLVNKQVVVLNQMSSSGERVLRQKDVEGIKLLLDKSYVDLFNVARIARLRAEEVVSDASVADVVFDRNYITPTLNEEETKEQKVIRPSDVEKMVALLK